MKVITLGQRYTDLQSWLHDYLIANRALNLHAYIIEQSKLDKVLEEKKQRKLLDVGCGGGQSAIRLKRLYPHLQLTGIDLSADQITRARQRAQRQGLALQFDVADAQALPYPEASFDVVYSFGSVKHWPDPLKGIGECLRVLKPGGELLLTDATSDATLEQVVNFYRIAHFPGLIEKPLSNMLYQRMFRPGCPMEMYQTIANQLGMPPGTVSQMPSLPNFLFRTQKPLSPA